MMLEHDEDENNNDTTVESGHSSTSSPHVDEFPSTASQKYLKKTLTNKEILYVLCCLKDGRISYKAVNEMCFMSAVINETQRMYSFSHSDREANEDYEFDGTRIKRVNITTNNFFPTLGPLIR